MSTISTLIDEFHSHTSAAKKIAADREHLKLSLAAAQDEKPLVEAEVTTLGRQYAAALVLTPKDSKLEASAEEALQAAKATLKRIEARITALTEAVETGERDRAEQSHLQAANSALSQAWQATMDAELAKVPSSARIALVRAYAAACRIGGHPGDFGEFVGRAMQHPSITELDAAARDLIQAHGLAA